MDKLSDTESMRGREFVVAGMVTDVTHATTKKGDPYGRFTVEDFGGSYEFVLFRGDYEAFRPFMFRGLPAHDTRQVHTALRRSRVYAQDNVGDNAAPKLMKTDQRADSKYGYIGGDPRDYRRDQNLFAENTGNANLRIKIFDPSAGVVLPMVSRNIKVDVTTAVADYFDKRGIRYDLR